MRFVVMMVAVMLGVSAGTVRADDTDDTLQLLLGVIKETNDPAAQADMLKGLNAAMEGKRNVKMPAGWQELYPKLQQSSNETVRKESAKLAAVFGDTATLDAMKKTLLDAKKPVEERLKALESLASKNDPATAALFQGLLKDPAVAEAAIKALSSFDDPKTAPAILDAYPALNADAKRAAVNTLSFRKAFAKQLMAAVKEKKIPQSDLTAYTVRQLRNLNDKEIDAWTASVWGVAKTSNEEKQKEIARYKAMMTDEVLKSGNPSAGRAIFAKICQQCHMLYGEGGKVGPDLTGSNRQELDYIFSNIIDPSSVIANDYMVTNVYMKDGDVFSGILVKEDEQSVSLQTESAVQVIQRAEVDQLRKSELSMMPEGLIATMPKEDLVNLVAYLRTSNQVPLPK